MGGTRALLGLVIGLGALIAIGLTVVVATLAHRMLTPAHGVVASAPVTLDEPPGTTVGGFVSTGDRLALLLEGGGDGERVVLLDPRDGSRVGTIAISGSPRSLPPVPRR